MTCVFLGGSSNSDSVVFKNAGFGKIKDYSWKTTPLQKKKNCHEGFGYVCNFHKKVFSGAPVSGASET